MGLDVCEMTENELATIIVDTAFKIHWKLGPGMLESVYETVLAQKLAEKGLPITRQQLVPIEIDGVRIDEGFRADLVVNDKVILELKSVESIAPVHSKQLLTYLRLTGKKLGLLLNFGAATMKEGMKRIVNGLEDEKCVTQRLRDEKN